MQKRLNITFAIMFCVVVSTTTNAALSRSQARNALRRAAGFELPGSAVRVKSVTDTSATSADITADVKMVFRFQKDENGKWHVREVRTGQDSWERIDTIAEALSAGSISECEITDPPFRGSLAIDPSVRRARCLLGALLGINVPSDALRIQEVSPLAIPIASQPSAVVTAWISVDARATRDKAGWRITDVRTGNRGWANLDAVAGSVNARKQEKARAELNVIADALEKYRRDRHAYIVSDSHAVLIDHLSPNYLLPVLRLDPWQQPYHYQGSSNQYTITSPGPDRKPNTADDIRVTGPAR